MTTTPPNTASPQDRQPDSATAGATVNKAAQGARDIVDKVAGLADEAARKAIPAAAQFAHKAVDSAAAGVAPVAAWLNEHSDEAGATQEKLLNDARKYIRDNPLRSVGIALAVGFLVSRIVR